MRVQAYALDVGSYVTIQRYSFFEILEILFWVALLFLVSIITYTSNYNSPIRTSKHIFKSFHFQSLQLTIKSTLAHSKYVFTDYLFNKKTHNIDINTCIKKYLTSSIVEIMN